MIWLKLALLLRHRPVRIALVLLTLPITRPLDRQLKRCGRRGFLSRNGRRLSYRIRPDAFRRR